MDADGTVNVVVHGILTKHLKFLFIYSEGALNQTVSISDIVIEACAGK